MSIGLFFDTETTGLWSDKFPVGDPRQPRMVQLGAILENLDTRTEIARLDLIIYREDPIPTKASDLNGTTTEISQRFGVSETAALDVFCDMVDMCDVLIAHNLAYDTKIVANAVAIHSPAGTYQNPFKGKTEFCTMLAATPICKVPAKYPKKTPYSWPKLDHTLKTLTGEEQVAAHTAIGDVVDCRKVYYHLMDNKEKYAAAA